MKLIVDAMGGDNAPEQIVLGAVKAAEELKEKIILVGNEHIIDGVIKKNHISQNLFEIIHAGEVITNNEEPAIAVRRKKNSSLTIGLNLLKEDLNNVFISAGSTGALLAGSLLYPGRIKGIKRPAIAVLLPNTLGRMTMLLDAGANADCKAEYLDQFALMGSVYMKKMYDISFPRIGLLNIGTEDKKGNALMQETFSLLKNSGLNFMGNIEGRDVLKGLCDVIVTDGFSGNLLLKSIEGTAEVFLGGIKEIIYQNTATKAAGAIIKKPLKEFAMRYDYTAYGGSPLLGIHANVIKAHGSSNSTAFKNAIIAGYHYGKNEILSNIIEIIIEKNDNI
jgi:glycerol-3-phosphate acyltransferase PlsX